VERLTGVFGKARGFEDFASGGIMHATPYPSSAVPYSANQRGGRTMNSRVLKLETTQDRDDQGGKRHAALKCRMGHKLHDLRQFVHRKHVLLLPKMQTRNARMQRLTPA
jgi:hypothetical protein